MARHFERRAEADQSRALGLTGELAAIDQELEVLKTRFLMPAYNAPPTSGQCLIQAVASRFKLAMEVHCEFRQGGGVTPRLSTKLSYPITCFIDRSGLI